MPIDEDLRGLMKDTVTLAAPSTKNNYGEVTFAAGTNYTARVVKKTEWIRDRTGEMKQAIGVVWTDRVTGATPEYKITLPDNTTPPILHVDKYPDDSGDYFEKIYLGY